MYFTPTSVVLRFKKIIDPYAVPVLGILPIIHIWLLVPSQNLRNILSAVMPAHCPVPPDRAPLIIFILWCLATTRFPESNPRYLLSLFLSFFLFSSWYLACTNKVPRKPPLWSTFFHSFILSYYLNSESIFFVPADIINHQGPEFSNDHIYHPSILYSYRYSSWQAFSLVINLGEMIHGISLLGTCMLVMGHADMSICD